MPSRLSQNSDSMPLPYNERLDDIDIEAAPLAVNGLVMMESLRNARLRCHYARNTHRRMPIRRTAVSALIIGRRVSLFY